MTEQTAIIAGGCFWCTEAVFNDVIGVSKVESGYIGGTTENPTYKQVCSGNTGHAEAIRVTFDDAQLSYADLLDIFFATHDPTQLNRQGNDVGTQYRSAIFPLDAVQQVEAEAAMSRNQANWPSTIVTTIEEPTTWYPAEDYHQEYWQGEGQRNPYCLAVIPPKLQKLRKSFAARVKA
ncbi:MAG: peptide-methionine (S)-S-oxide reductase [Sphingomonadales bacterium RIFCSPHIGHO2_01_FULL_65_20]|uniref:Peptide methionine sulfoxide reductase MsrA n=1 Tax=Sphingomonas ursincola TaxID=56361 RepID=A0A7V8U9U6_9SPHN|nr:peptide-methionine (S)-S-oxide reductase MsrA [Sphingomonas ursincola]MBA1376131.1 peptide-methionine (S)-S-oxide reductase MsrA [Sphingomonas ursincola]MBY0620280.1 peptide-methionine (S)-S-oxide reductase MsrA [Sphingomonas ursincola]MCH2238689.1 peptide-methionine (S)-S-oxide reductase MsrA [Blastomonas sp.]OHC94066.1 MAG: peptide-methionine (S)-S-oxide reductase [Sphingomonadales bacterium RIFCSPHIGHO2_01_FULL_65_20]